MDRPAFPPENVKVQDWLRAQRALLEGERRLTEAAERYARKAASAADLEGAHEAVLALRELSEAVLQRVLEEGRDHNR